MSPQQLLQDLGFEMPPRIVALLGVERVVSLFDEMLSMGIDTTSACIMREFYGLGCTSLRTKEIAVKYRGVLTKYQIRKALATTRKQLRSEGRNQILADAVRSIKTAPQ